MQHGLLHWGGVLVIFTGFYTSRVGVARGDEAQDRVPIWYFYPSAGSGLLLSLTPKAYVQGSARQKKQNKYIVRVGITTLLPRLFDRLGIGGRNLPRLIDGDRTRSVEASAFFVTSTSSGSTAVTVALLTKNPRSISS